jgi:DNA-directed RNA polymerase sigma subunit (sigma70/sigma32)
VEHTLEEVGAQLSLTRERIRQIERAALAKLRALPRRNAMRSLIAVR